MLSRISVESAPARRERIISGAEGTAERDVQSSRAEYSGNLVRQALRKPNYRLRYFVRVMSSIFWGLVSFRRQLGKVHT